MTQKLPSYYRPITLEGIDPVKPYDNVGTPIKMRWIRIEQLFVDTRYQRNIAKGLKSNVRQIGAHFLWRRFAPVVVTPIQDHPDCFSIIDGQHKSTGALLRGLTIVPCAIVEAETLEQQADAFKFLNDNITRIGIYDIHKANLAAKDPLAVRIDKAAKDCGIRIVSGKTSNKDMQHGDCKTYKSFAAHLKNHKAPVFFKAMRALSKNPYSKGIINSIVMGAYCQVLKSNPQWVDDPAVTIVLESINILALLNTAHSLYKQENSTVKAVLTRMIYERIVEKRIR